MAAFAAATRNSAGARPYRRPSTIANRALGDTNFNALPTGSSIGGQSQVEVWNAELKALGGFGVVSPNDSTTDDGYAGFAKGIPDSEMVGVALHELTHAMGRVPYGGDEPDIFDFYRYRLPSPGMLLQMTLLGVPLDSFGYDQPPAPAAYFSVDGGNTPIADYGLVSDPSDFLNASPLKFLNGTTENSSSPLTVEDAFDQGYDPNTIQHLTQVDLTQLDVLGFNTWGDTPPVLSIGNPNVTFTGGGPAVTLDNALTVTDQESPTLASAVVSIGSVFISGDTLNFTAQNGIIGSYISATGVLTLSGTASLADYQAVLDSVTYTFAPSNGDPTFGGSDTSRAIDWVVNDGGTTNGLSAVATSTIAIHAPPSPPTPLGTTADMIMRDAANGIYEIYDIGKNTILAAGTLLQVGLEWQVAGLGGFYGTDTSDMILRNSNTGALQVYDVSNNTTTSVAPMGQVGLEWQVSGFGDLSSRSGETDMPMQATSGPNAGAFEVYDIGNNAITSAAPMGQAILGDGITSRKGGRG
jgi:hypothetical protein